MWCAISTCDRGDRFGWLVEGFAFRKRRALAFLLCFDGMLDCLPGMTDRRKVTGLLRLTAILGLRPLGRKDLTIRRRGGERKSRMRGKCEKE